MWGGPSGDIRSWVLTSFIAPALGSLSLEFVKSSVLSQIINQICLALSTVVVMLYFVTEFSCQYVYCVI